MANDLGRRELIKLTAGVALAGRAVFAQSDAPLFFSKDEFALIDEASDIIIPSDDHSPGARAVGCAVFIDKMLAQSDDEGEKQHWREGPHLIDALCAEMHGAPFLKVTPEQRVAVVERMAEHESKSFERHRHGDNAEAVKATPVQAFFLSLKGSTAHAYYTSEIGIHKEMEYRGNVLLKEFAGIEVT